MGSQFKKRLPIREEREPKLRRKVGVSQTKIRMGSCVSGRGNKNTFERWQC